MPLFWWVGLDVVLLVGWAASGGVFWGICELNMTLDNLSVNGWCCVPVLLVVSWGIQHWSLLDIGWSWVLTLKWRSLGELLLIDFT